MINKWISIKDRLPNDGDEILIYSVTDNNISIGYRKHNNFFDLIDFTMTPAFDVTHWMPLTKAPEIIK